MTGSGPAEEELHQRGGHAAGWAAREKGSQQRAVGEGRAPAVVQGPVQCRDGKGGPQQAREHRLPLRGHGRK